MMTQAAIEEKKIFSFLIMIFGGILLKFLES